MDTDTKSFILWARAQDNLEEFSSATIRLYEAEERFSEISELYFSMMQAPNEKYTNDDFEEMENSYARKKLDYEKAKEWEEAARRKYLDSKREYENHKALCQHSK